MATTRKTTPTRAARPARPARETAAPRPAARADDDLQGEEETEYTEADAQEAEATGHYVTSELCGEEVRIIPPGAWRQSWRRLLMSGQIDEFAQITLHPDDYELYEELDPTNDEFGDLVNMASERAGESPGKSRGPAPSSRRTRRR
ncbi:hypothetical protein ACIQFU_23185 [Streptomyces sp. NPDC093065]|uniref:hypothetical protein n=1 Tax=Streptomyces sp. NPDC093065 TaxID=3366021 RepID=UPI003829CDCE